jgi:tetratricopeptide (TPR) repeat protein
MQSSDFSSFSKRRCWIYSSILVLLFFGLLEAGLMLVGVKPLFVDQDPYVGFSSQLPLLVPASGDEDKQMMEIAPNKLRWFNQQRFPVAKGEKTYRIFCLGGSTTHGRPYDHRTAFCGWLQGFLEAADPSRTWEIINLGGVSYASYRVAAMMPELGSYQPDMFIVYTGHNEFLEERTYREIKEIPGWLRDLSAGLTRLRLYSLMKRVLETWRSPAADITPHVVSLNTEVDEILTHTAGPKSYQRDDKLSADIQSHYRFNLQRIIKQAQFFGAEILFVQPAAKLRDESPFKSSHKEGLSASDLNTWNDLFASGQQLYNQKEYESALAAYDQAIAIDDRYAELHYWRGQALFELQRYAEARIALQRSLDEDVVPLRILRSMQQVLREVATENQVPLIDFPAIISDMSRQRLGHDLPGRELFLDHVHPTIEMHKLLALALFEHLRQQGVVRPTAAWGQQAIAGVEATRMAMVDSKLQQRSLLSLAAVLGWAGKFEEAFELVLRSQHEFGNNSETMSRLAMYSSNRGKKSEALVYAREWTQLYPENIEAWIHLAVLLVETNQLTEAVVAYRRALGLKPESVDIHQVLAELLTQLGRRQEAIVQIEKIVRLDPNVNEAYLNLGLLHAELMHYDRAEQYLHQALERNPKSSDAFFALAVIWEIRQRPDKALDYYHKAQLYKPENPVIANNLGALLARTGKVESAIEQFELALKINPDYTEAQRNLAAARSR